MHALVGVFRMDPARQAERRVGLHEHVLPRLREEPGFVCGSWSYDADLARGHAYIVCDSADAARRLAGLIEVSVELESLTIAVVIGETRRPS